MKPRTPEHIGQLWQAVERTSRELVWELSPDGTLLFLTDAAAEVLGASSDELVGENGFLLVHEEDRPYALSEFARAYENGTGWDRIRVRVVRPDGETPWVETSGIAHLDEDHRPIGWTATTRLLDTDEIRQVERERVRRRVLSVIEGRLFDVVWQPIFSLIEGRIVGVEALSRFRHSLDQPPDRWFDDAASVGLQVELETIATEVALQEAAEFPRDVYVSVNASPAFASSGALAAVIDSAPIPPSRVVLELTEHVSVEDYDRLKAPLDHLREAGVRLAVDDAGAGFASFRHILRLNPNIIKLDQSIVLHITHNPAQRALATAVVLFALEAGPMTIVAEGVEFAEDLATVTLLSIDAAQGFHMARPVAAADIDWARRVTMSQDTSDSIASESRP